MIEKFYELLKIDGQEHQYKNGREVALMTRLVKMGYGVVCGRCGGGGSYSYNQRDGSRCYGCGGYGFRKPKLTKKLFEQVSADVADGALDRYLEAFNRSQTVKKADKILKDLCYGEGKTEIDTDYHIAYSRKFSDDFDETTKNYRFKSGDILQEWSRLNWHRTNELSNRRKPPTKERIREIEDELFAKFEEIRNRLIANENEYRAIKAQRAGE